MSYKLHSDEEKRLQKKLIPLNIFVALLALVAAVSLIITPLLKINLKAVMDSFGSGEEGETSQISVVTENVDAEIELAPLDMVKVLIAPENEKGAVLVSALLVDNGILENLMVSFINVSLAVATQAIESAEDLEKLDVAALNEALCKIDNAKSSDDVVKELDDYLKLLEQQLGTTLTDDMKEAAKENCKELYDNTVKATGGSFSVEEMICVNMSTEGGKVYTSYSDLIAGYLNGEIETSEGMASLTEFTSILNQVAAPYGYMFIFVAFHALMWFILFLFAFFRMFAKNKRFTMWYVKLVSCWPCIIFFLLPFAMSKFGGSVAVLAPYAGVFAAITSMTWISGICYLLLWVFSICWAFPIKHKIRKLRKQRA